MSKVRINISIDEQTKKEARAILKSLGLTMSSAIELFFRQVVLQKRIPFEITEYENVSTK